MTAAAVLASSLVVGSTYAAELTASTSNKVQMDAASCQHLEADVLASGATADIKSKVKSAGASACWTSTSSSWSGATALGVGVAAASSGCGSYYGTACFSSAVALRVIGM